MQKFLSKYHLPFFNGPRSASIRGLGAFLHAGKVSLYFVKKTGKSNELIRTISHDGFHFELDEQKPNIKFERLFADYDSLNNFTFTQHHGLFILSFLRHKNEHITLNEAWSQDQDHWRQKFSTPELTTPIYIVPNFKIHGRYIMYSGQENISLYSSSDLKDWREDEVILKPRPGLFDHGAISVDFVHRTSKGILVLYSCINDGHYSVGVALMDLNDPKTVIWRANQPIWTTPKNWQGKAKPFGIILHRGRLISYWQVKDDGFFAVVYGLYKLSDGHSSKDVSLKLNRSHMNPMISPNPHNSWEAFTTFNPAAVYADGKIHLLYRAQGYDYISVVGYAQSEDGHSISKRFSEPAYLPSEAFEYTGHNKPKKISQMYVSGGGYGGAEDPRATIIGDRLYMTYVAFDGYNPPRVALTSIALDHFLNQNWLWEKPVLISPPGVVDKSAVIFPEKIKGKYVIMHRIYPDILIDYVDSLEFDGKTWLKGEHKISPRPGFWDSRKIGAGAPPLKTKDGWLLIYQSVGEQDSSKYKVGAMLLDLEDPSKVLHRSQSPILEPDAPYENEGFKAGVIYPCGAAIVKDTLYVYYGGADSHVCVATANLNEFLQELKHSEIAKLTEPIMEKLF